MPLSMYELSVPVFVKFLTNLSGILDKAAAHCEASKIDPAAMLATRLHPNMFTLAQQVEVATDHAASASAVLAGLAQPALPDGGDSFATAKARIAFTIDFLVRLEPAQMAGSEAREVTIQMGPRPRRFLGQTLLSEFTLPNFYFHVTTAYDILRHCGVELSKRDYSGERR
jgi:uncharacterized protein